MISRPLPRLALVTGLLLLVAGVFALEGVFVRERADALDALGAERAALRQYALKDLQERCEDALEANRSRLEAALHDFLVDPSGLLYLRAGRQILPRQFTFLEEPSVAEPLYRRLKTGALPTSGLDPEDPWLAQLRYLADFRDALEVGNTEGIERVFRAVLTQRARFTIDSRKELVHQVVLLELLQEKAEVEPELMRTMLRDGLTDSRGTRIPGLQVQLLARREKLTRSDFEFLAERIARLSESSGVRHDDFRGRVAEPSGPAVTVPEQVPSSMLIERGAWFILPSGGEVVEGVALDLPALLGHTRSEMLDRGLLTAEDRLSLAEPPGDPRPVDALGVSVESPRWERDHAAIERRFWLKTGLAVTLLGLMGGAAVLWSAWTRRERQLLALKSDFVTMASHELRTPLASIRLMAETLDRRLRGANSAHDYPGRIIREIDSLAFLVENILSFARLERGRWDPRLEDVRLSDVVRALKQELPGATRAQVEVQFEAEDDLMLRADPELMRLLFLNLGTNACKYCNGDRVVIRIEAEARDPLVIRMADNGIGIPADQIEKVFAEFYRAERGGRGFGLGLTICRRIMDLHQGRIRVADSSTRGTVFELSFP